MNENVRKPQLKRYTMYLNCMVPFQLKTLIFCCWWELEVLMNHILNRIILLTVKISLTFVALVKQSDMWPASWISWFFKFDIISGSHALWTNKVKKKKQHYCFAVLLFASAFCFLLNIIKVTLTRPEKQSSMTWKI